MGDLPLLSRRGFHGLLTGAAGLAIPGGAVAAAVSDLSPLHRFMKVFASLDAGEIWYWYGGTIEMARPGEPIVSLVGIQTLIRRQVAPQPDGSFAVTTWEAGYFHGLGSEEPLDSMTNPATSKIVHPFHFREGRRVTVYNDARLTAFGAPGIESVTSWKNAGPYSWLRRELHIDVAHPLDIKRWPKETPDLRNRSGSFSTHCVLTRDLGDPAIANAPCSFNYEAVFGWFPWLLMGQQPGHLVWRANGLKLPTRDDLPASSRKGFEAVFPAMLAAGEPWTDNVLMWDDYQRQRVPG